MAYSFPVPSLSGGFMFKPSDEELVVQYLRPRAMNLPVPCAVIVDVHILHYNPWDLVPEGSTEKYFFSKKELKYKVGSRSIRTTNQGFWRATGLESPIISTTGGELVGMKRSMTFYRGHARNGERTVWAMKEYRLAGAGLGPFRVMRPVPTAVDIGAPSSSRSATAIAKKNVDPKVAPEASNSHAVLVPFMVTPDESCVLCRVYRKKSRAPRTIAQANNALGHGARYIDFMGVANRELSATCSSTADATNRKELNTGSSGVKKVYSGNNS